VGRAVIRDLYHGADAQRLMSQVSMIFGIAPAIAPIIGGWILLGGGDWPLIFWFLVAFALVLTLNALTIGMSFIGIFLAASYPYLKRYTHLPQVYLGMAFGWGIPMAFAAIQGEVPVIGWLLYGANILWSTAYDTWYAMVDRDDDLKMGSHSTAILFGDLDLVIQGILYALFLGTMALVGVRGGLGLYYWLGVLLAAGLIAYEFWIARKRERDPCFKAFLHNNWVGAALFAGIAAALAAQ